MILGLDTTNYVHTIWHAQKGTGVLGTVRMRLTALVDRLKPSHVVACFDRRSFRYDIFPAYKAGRKEKDPGLCRDLQDAPEAIQDIATIAAEDGFEADDCLASLAALGVKIEQKVVLASPDKDLRQCLVEGSVTILRDFRTDHGEVTSLDWFTAARLKEDYKLTPGQWPDYQALVGDATDGIPGCVGWGPVTAGKATASLGSFQAILANPLALKLTQKQAAALMRFKPQAETMLRLVTLRTDVAAVVDAIR